MNLKPIKISKSLKEIVIATPTSIELSNTRIIVCNDRGLQTKEGQEKSIESLIEDHKSFMGYFEILVDLSLPKELFQQEGQYYFERYSKNSTN